jgi:hypothetical protein
MQARKIVALVGIALAVVGAFVAIPNLAAILLIAGLFIGLSIDGADHVRVIVSALALVALSGSMSSIPAIGGPLAAILTNFGLAATGTAIMIILRNMYARFKP